MGDSGKGPDFPAPGLDLLQRSVWSAIGHYKKRIINIAFSGGVDSTVLLMATASLRPRMGLQLRALHVNHGWSEDADRWHAHCQRVARELDIPFLGSRPDSDIPCAEDDPAFAGSSKEARARAARYRFFADVVAPEDLLLTGHHLDDQAETFLLRLMRGSSVRGLGSMRSEQTLNGLKVIRPFLDIPKATLTGWALEKGVKVLDDPSNRDAAFDRNFLRHDILAKLSSRWVEAAETLGRAAAHFQGTQSILNEVASDDLRICALAQPRCYLGHLGAASLSALLGLSRPRLLNAFRFWTRQSNLGAPSERALEEFIRQLERGSPGASPTLSLGTATFRTYRDGVFLIPEPLPGISAAPKMEPWDGSRLSISSVGIELIPEETVGSGLRVSLIREGRVELRWRRGQTKVTPVGRGPHRHQLRKVLQQAGVPPWERARIPLIFIDDRFAGMPQVVLDESCRARAGEAGLKVRLRDLRKPGP
ncbi:MAG: tRNA lysidine(34) synthetase TilS [Acidiferrobacteraceae bacterium]|nr:tRNA lysidine(34) synthetase TilS [Acidiferrobacteraceae bacterium]MDP6552360.1 tRNA lysidine(34) synthetase TilS [Arenicellales bacterium]MDP6790353.1 tRNA lysidine(34) synthetase TilS [Arenicellales bacterium]MDP6918173.1 tRNA lysidine(34) synthetase TilS [Arenicellales bacterium]